jgi:hypothetical protein
MIVNRPVTLCPESKKSVPVEACRYFKKKLPGCQEKFSPQGGNESCGSIITFYFSVLNSSLSELKGFTGDMVPAQPSNPMIRIATKSFFMAFMICFSILESKPIVRGAAIRGASAETSPKIQ